MVCMYVCMYVCGSSPAYIAMHSEICPKPYSSYIGLHVNGIARGISSLVHT